MEPFVNFVIRPPRAEYSVGDLLEAEFTIKGRSFQRKDLEIINSKGQVLQCSHYVPMDIPEDTKLPCVIYCHGNSGCRADGNGAAFVLLPSNITVFTLDFSGSGLSDGDFVSLGWNEKEDLKAVVTYVRSLKQTSCIGLWGRSMGAVTSLLYGAEDPSIAGMVLDSPFSNLFTLMMELVDVYKIRLPKFTIRVALQIMRRIIQKRVQFDIMDMNIVQHASKTFIPALFGHAIGDAFIPPHHSDLIHREYAGDKNIIKFEGDHNSSRPQFYYDSVTIFFHNVLGPPAEETCNFLAYDLNAFPPIQGLVEHSFCGALNEPIHSMQSSGGSEEKMKLPQQETLSKIDGIIGSCTSGKENIPQQETFNKFAEANVLQSRKSNLENPTELIRQMKGNHSNPEFFTCDQLESRGREQSGDCCSYPSSNGISTEGWTRCSSPGISEKSIDGSSGRQIFAEIPPNVDEEEKMILRAISVALQEANALKVEELLSADNDSVITPRRKCRFEAFSRRFGLGCFRGMGKRSKETT